MKILATFIAISNSLESRVYVKVLKNQANSWRRLLVDL